MIKLELERRDQENLTPVLGGGLAAFTPPVSEAYWAYRVRVSDGQAVVGFPKFATIGIGFAAEEDWNTNLPYSSPTATIVDHIFHNAGDPAITKDVVHEAVWMVQRAALEDVAKMRRDDQRRLREQLDSGVRSVPARDADAFGTHVHKGLLEQEMLLARIAELEHEVHVLTSTEDGAAVLADIEAKLLRDGVMELADEWRSQGPVHGEVVRAALAMLVARIPRIAAGAAAKLRSDLNRATAELKVLRATAAEAALLRSALECLEDSFDVGDDMPGSTFARAVREALASISVGREQRKGEELP